MKKILSIGWKDLKIAFRDRAAMVMLLGPFVLTLAMGLVTGAFSEDGSGMERIPVALVNLDTGGLGAALEDQLTTADFQDLIRVEKLLDVDAAKNAVLEDRFAAALVIPPTFSEDLIQGTPPGGAEAWWVVELIANPAQPIRADIVRTVVDLILESLLTGAVSGRVVVTELIADGVIPPEMAFQKGQETGQQVVLLSLSQPQLSLEQEGTLVEKQGADLNPLALLAPSMALLFLIYTVTSVGGRSILAEREDGTLARIMASPTLTSEVLGGKVFGILFIGVAQVGILILASTLLFQLKWGDPLGLVVLIPVAVLGAAGWGILLAAVAKTPSQVSTVGTAMMLLFGLLGGSFFGGASFTGPLGLLGKLTPNAWAQDGFVRLAEGGTLLDLGEPVAGLLIMALVLFAIAVTIFRRRGLMGG